MTEWFYFYGGPLDWHTHRKMVQSHGMREHVMQIADLPPCEPGEVMDYGAFDLETAAVTFKNHLYMRQHRGDWAPGHYSPSATYEYQYKGTI